MDRKGEPADMSESAYSEERSVPEVATGGAVPVEAGTPGVPAGVTARGTVPQSETPAGAEPGAPPHTRVSATWTAVAGALVLLVVVVVFLLENLQEVRVSFFGLHWRAPLAVDLLLAVVLGGLFVFSAGAIRILQVRLHGRRQRRSLRARSGRPVSRAAGGGGLGHAA